MKIKELIELNNQKREELTKENEAYYSDVLMYVRLRLELSEQHSEEILMDILDHLIEAQQADKTARDIFGADPVAYAETIIAELPKEKKRNIGWFLVGVACSILGPVLIIRGLFLLIAGWFIPVNQHIPSVTTLIIGMCIIIYIVAIISFILKQVRTSITKQSSTLKGALITGLFAAISMGILLLIIYTLPELGPSLLFPWWLSIVSGATIGLVLYFIKKKTTVIHF